MKTRTIVTSVMIATVLLTQSVVASSNVPAQQSPAAATQQTAPVVPTQAVLRTGEVAGSNETYAELIERVKEDSLRQLSGKLNAEELVGEALGSTVRALVGTTLNGKPQL
jgi:hypothetical protein